MPRDDNRNVRRLIAQARGAKAVAGMWICGIILSGCASSDIARGHKTPEAVAIAMARAVTAQEDRVRAYVTATELQVANSGLLAKLDASEAAAAAAAARAAECERTTLCNGEMCASVCAPGTVALDAWVDARRGHPRPRNALAARTYDVPGAPAADVDGGVRRDRRRRGNRCGR